jgi:hypothetical protein
VIITTLTGAALPPGQAEGVMPTTAPLAKGASTVVELNLDVQTPGVFRFHVNIEALTVPPQ